MAALGPLGLGATPDTDERVLLPLPSDRRLLAVAGINHQLGREAHEDVHDRAPEVVEGILRSAHCAREERVSREYGLIVDDEREHPACVPRRSQGLDTEVSGLDDLAVPERL